LRAGPSDSIGKLDQMKPLQIGVLVLVGALGGALIMKFSQRQAPGIVPAPIVTPAPVAVPPPDAAPPIVPPAAVEAPPVAAEPAAEPAPSPFPKKSAITRVHHARAARASVTMIAQNLPSAAEPIVQEPSAPEQMKDASAPPETAMPAAPPAASEPTEVPAAPPQPAPTSAPSVTLRAGTLLPVRLGESLSSEHNQAGDTFTATLDVPLTVDGFVIAERGARVEGRVIEAQKPSHMKGQPALALELTRLNTSDGQHVGIQTDAFRKQAVTSTEQDVGIVAAAAGVGAVIGAMAGGGKGAGIGAAAGGVAGAGGVMATRPKAVALPSETKISFRLSQTITITEQMSR
jgi:hypothetical protein